MMRVQKIIAVLFIVGSIGHAAEKKMSFIDANFEDFAKRVSRTEEERALFKVYFANLVEKIQEAHEKNPQKEKATYRYLYSLALNKLEEKHVDWYNEIKPFVTDARFTLDEQLDEVRRVIKFFLTRYGAYEEFLNFKAAQLPGDSMETIAQTNQKNWWDHMKDYALCAKNKIVGWFGFGSYSKEIES